NVLFEGPEAAIESVLLLLEPRLRKPVVWKRSRAPFDVPIGQVGGLILEEVAGLSPEEQTRLLLWLDAAGSCTRILATTGQTLFPLVASGLFDAALYYRLNVMLLRLEWNKGPRVPATDAEHGRSWEAEPQRAAPQ